MLNAYLTATSNLLQNPAAPNALYSTANLTSYINTARGQLAGESACIRVQGAISISSGTRGYVFGNISLPGASGVQDVLNVRTVWLVSGSGMVWLTPVSYEEFSLYDLNSASPATGAPTKWAQYGQSVLGSVLFSPIPSAPGTAKVDCVCLPVPLADDTTPEAIPALWTDAVPYFAAYLALLSSQTGVRTAEADKMFERYQMFVERARRAATSAVLPWQFDQVQVPGGVNAQVSQGAGGQR